MIRMMASVRRCVNRKRRCMLTFLLVCIVFFTFSWLMNDDDYSSPIVKSNFSRADIVIPPKFNVLAEPPKPAASKPEKENFASKPENEKSASKPEKVTSAFKPEKESPKTANISNIKANATTKNETVEHLGVISVQDANNQIKETIVIKPESQQTANESVKIEIAKNKTLAQVGVLGGNFSKKIIFAKEKWNLTVSFEDIGNVMKDTSFFNNLKPLDVRGPFLTSTKNRTANFSLSMPIKMGYCDCWEHYCFCCVQLVNKQLHLNTKSCANFTFISKSHNLDVTFSLDGIKVHNEVISADAPPMLCMGSYPKVADMCVHFSNMTYKVDRLAMHKSQLYGCTDFSFNIYNKTVNVFPVDCFQIPGDPNHHPKREQIFMPNFVP